MILRSFFNFNIKIFSIKYTSFVIKIFTIKQVLTIYILYIIDSFKQ